MKRSKQQILDISNKKYCAQYLKPDWDGCAANEYFIRLYDFSRADKYLYKPKIELFNSLRETDMAENSLYFDICPKAFIKDTLVDYLIKINPNQAHVPDIIEDRERYIKVYISVAKNILENIINHSYPFQRNIHI